MDTNMMRDLHFTVLCLLTASAASAQNFYLHNELGGFLEVTPPLKAGMPRLLAVHDFHGLDSQLWAFDPVKESKDVFVIRSATKGGEVIEVTGASPRGAPPVMKPFSGAVEQQWKTQRSRAADVVQLQSQTGWFLDVPWHTYENGLPVGTWTGNDFFTQHWQVVNSSSVAPREVGLRCPVPTNGPGDYGGSPFITLTADTSLTEDGSAVLARVTFRADRPMGTELAHGEWTETIFTASPSQRILGIMPDSLHSEWAEWAPAAGAEYGTCHAGEMFERHPTTGPVSSFFFIGDTGFIDFNMQAHTGDCGCDSQLSKVTFNPLGLVIGPR